MNTTKILESKTLLSNDGTIVSFLNKGAYVQIIEDGKPSHTCTVRTARLDIKNLLEQGWKLGSAN
jgi:hypothetical protein